MVEHMMTKKEMNKQMKAGMKKGKGKKHMMTPEKAKKIMEDGEVKGHKLTKKQKGFFGARAAGLPARKPRSKKRYS